MEKLTPNQETQIRVVIDRFFREHQAKSNHWTWTQFKNDLMVEEMLDEIKTVIERR